MKLTTLWLFAIGALLACTAATQAADNARTRRPNLLLIITDQQFSEGMSCRIGNRYINTPGMDRLAKQGMLFTRAYAANPLCTPFRTSLFSGHYPHQTGVQTNGRGTGSHKTLPCLGTYFAKAGYETGYFGKWHTPYALKDSSESGFETVHEKDCLYSTKRIVTFLEAKHDKPFLAVASFMNPHNICEWSRFQKMGSGPLEVPPVEQRPPLPPNHASPENETDVMAFMRKSYQAHRLFPVGDYTEDDWRRHVWGYYRLIERVDAHVVKLLEVLEATGLDKNTVVLFTSDHGDCHGAHRWVQKTVFYDESARIPLILSYPGQPTRGQTCDHLINTGVDIGPTLLDFAGIPIPNALPGKSFRPITEDKTRKDDRDYIVSQNRMVQCVPIDGVSLTPDGRMVRSARYKYCLYSEGKQRESLVDMEEDPLETVNRAADPQLREVLLRHRGYLREFADKHGDATAKSMLDAVERDM
ncbi:MAG: sulfatase-like hydrolase/transferase [Candidatus Nealsonbacteria bacterium]|nr:sulfatase-like hydrolase/transferase [Candidatus Nealsonbacteria bacterium]